ncbi:MAG: sulfotransferase domain-containing protein [Candidatus Kuenenia stuttgartiensis]|nr:sulfotransferase domain-containing protein [Candidatus Kuenenia stuttgartiensis]
MMRLLLDIARKYRKKFQHYQTYQKIKYFESINNFDPKKNIIITGSPRSGTTWLQELFCDIEKTYPLFEPLHLDGSPKFKEIGFEWGQYIPEDYNWPEAKELFESLFRGQYLTPFMISHARVAQLKNADFLIIKYVRANSLLPWFVRQFDIRPPIYILRHPCAAIASQMKMNWYTCSKFTIPKTKFPEKYTKYEHILNNINTTLEYVAAKWCLDNIIPLNHHGNNRLWITVFYENLIANPHEEVPYIFYRLNLELPRNLWYKVNVPSAMTGSISPLRQNKIEQLSKWKNELSERDIDSILGMLKKFEIKIYDDNIFPVKNKQTPAR